MIQPENLVVEGEEESNITILSTIFLCLIKFQKLGFSILENILTMIKIITLSLLSFNNDIQK
jgi:hypothetical protein